MSVSPKIESRYAFSAFRYSCMEDVGPTMPVDGCPFFGRLNVIENIDLDTVILSVRVIDGLVKTLLVAPICFDKWSWKFAID